MKRPTDAEAAQAIALFAAALEQQQQQSASTSAFASTSAVASTSRQQQELVDSFKHATADATKSSDALFDNYFDWPSSDDEDDPDFDPSKPTSDAPVPEEDATPAALLPTSEAGGAHDDEEEDEDDEYEGDSEEEDWDVQAELANLLQGAQDPVFTTLANPANMLLPTTGTSPAAPSPSFSLNDNNSIVEPARKRPRTNDLAVGNSGRWHDLEQPAAEVDGASASASPAAQSSEASTSRNTTARGSQAPKATGKRGRPKQYTEEEAVARRRERGREWARQKRQQKKLDGDVVQRENEELREENRRLCERIDELEQESARWRQLFGNEDFGRVSDSLQLVASALKRYTSEHDNDD